MYQLMVEASIASKMKNVARVLGINSVINKRSYKTQVALWLSSCPCNLAYAILDVKAGANNIELDGMELSLKKAKNVKPHRLRLATGTPLWVIGSIKLDTQIEKWESYTYFFVIKNLAVAILLGYGGYRCKLRVELSIKANDESIKPSALAMKCNDHKDSPFAQGTMCQSVRCDAKLQDLRRYLPYCEYQNWTEPQQWDFK